MVLRTKCSLQKPECPRMGLWWTWTQTCLQRSEKVSQGKWHSYWILKEKYKFTREVRLEDLSARANHMNKGGETAKYMVYLLVTKRLEDLSARANLMNKGGETAKYTVYLLVTKSMGCRVWAQVESEPRWRYSVLQCRYMSTVWNT